MFVAGIFQIWWSTWILITTKCKGGKKISVNTKCCTQVDHQRPLQSRWWGGCSELCGVTMTGDLHHKHPVPQLYTITLLSLCKVCIRLIPHVCYVHVWFCVTKLKNHTAELTTKNPFVFELMYWWYVANEWIKPYFLHRRVYMTYCIYELSIFYAQIIRYLRH